jgi:hypothetical protein
VAGGGETMQPDQELPKALAATAAFFDAEGRACDWAALDASRERGRLAICLEALEGFDPAGVRIAGQTAFWLNVFNAAVLRDAPELELALEGVKPEVQPYFQRPRLRIHGLDYSLDDIYHGVLRGNAPAPGHMAAPMRHDDPRLEHVPIALDERLHFALYRGARSSPAFRVFGGGRLDAQLDEAVAQYLRREARVEDGGRVIRAPKLLEWYAADFGGKGGALEFVLDRLDEPEFALAERHMGHHKLRFAEFDWRLARR